MSTYVREAITEVYPSATYASGVGGARLEGWPPPFPDATVRGENENIRHGLWARHARHERN